MVGTLSMALALVDWVPSSSQVPIGGVVCVRIRGRNRTKCEFGKFFSRSFSPHSKVFGLALVLMLFFFFPQVGWAIGRRRYRNSGSHRDYLLTCRAVSLRLRLAGHAEVVPRIKYLRDKARPALIPSRYPGSPLVLPSIIFALDLPEDLRTQKRWKASFST